MNVSSPAVEKLLAHVPASTSAPAPRPAVPLPETRPDEDWFQPDPAIHLEAKQVTRQLHCDEIIATRLVSLGLSAQEISDYLHPVPQHIEHPEATMPGTLAAARALAVGVAADEMVAIYADYDVDGQTSLAILSGALESYGARLHVGSANAVTGFGLSRVFVEQAAAAGARWLVTVDCGSTQTEPVRLAQSLGMRVIIIDHHDVDIDNSAEHHLNPKLFAAQALREICTAVTISECRQKLEFKGPYDEQLHRLTERSQTILSEYFGEEAFIALGNAIERNSHPTNTGSMLTWKFTSALYLATQPRVPLAHWGLPLYLAGLGAIADLASCANQEVRSFVRVSTDTELQHTQFGNEGSVPLGLILLADALGENVNKPDTLIRTRALINLPKRTAQIRPEDIQTLLRSNDLHELQRLVPLLVHDYERLSAVRREEMDPAALEQVAEAAAAGETSFFATAVLDDFPEYAGYTRMVANTLNKETGKPSVAFAYKGQDEFGQHLYKFSGANDVVPDAHLGDLIHDSALQEACTLQMRDWLNNPADLVNLGGHTAVVSGVVRREMIPAAKAAFEAWAQHKADRHDWHVIERKRPRVARRRISPTRLHRLEHEAELLHPLSFPEAPAVQVSVNAQIAPTGLDPATGGWTGKLLLEDNSERESKLSDEVAALARSHPEQSFECIVSLGGSGYYVSHVAAN